MSSNNDTTTTSTPNVAPLSSSSSPKQPTTQQFSFPPPPASSADQHATIPSTKFGARSLHTAISLGDGDAVKKILDSGIRLSVMDAPGPLHLVATSPEAHHIVPLLIDCGAEIERRDEEGNTPLHNFVKANMLQAVAILLSRGADVNAINHQLDTPLHLAAASSSSSEQQDDDDDDMMILLLSYGADENAKNAQGLRPADYKLPLP